MFPVRFMAQASLVGLLGLATVAPLSQIGPAMAQAATQDYDTYMRLGYSLTARRDYQSALINFRKALSLRPGDRYATNAISNVQAYIARAQVANRPSANRLAYIPNIGMPSRTVAGGTRGTTCTPGTTELTALAPKDSLAFTASSSPDLFFYLPTSTARAVELMILDEQGNFVERRQYRVNSTAGIAKISLNPNQGLEVGKKYKWIFSLVCSDDPSGFPYVEGWVERIDLDPNMLQAMNSAPLADRLTLYATNKIWNDTLTTLAELQKNNPGSPQYQEQWQTYLEEAGVNPAIAKMPLIDCCQAQ